MRLCVCVCVYLSSYAVRATQHSLTLGLTTSSISVECLQLSHYAECQCPNAAMLSLLIFNVFMLSVVIVSDMVPLSKVQLLK